jgi:hypothetical protein
LDSLLSIAQMPGGIPVADLRHRGIGGEERGPVCRRALALQDEALAKRFARWRARQTKSVASSPKTTNVEEPDGERVPLFCGPARSGFGDRDSRRWPIGPDARTAPRPDSDSARTFIPTKQSRALSMWQRRQTRAEYGNEDALGKFAAACDVVTFEFENVPDSTALYLADHVAVAPSPRALHLAQDRFLEKSSLRGLALPPHSSATSRPPRTQRMRFRALGGPAVLKTRKLGYDGKGQKIVRSADEASQGFSELGAVPSILEKFVDFAFEASVVGARARDGSFAAYDPPKNEHENHILRRSIVPAGAFASQCRERDRYRAHDRGGARLCRRARRGAVHRKGRTDHGQ